MKRRAQATWTGDPEPQKPRQLLVRAARGRLLDQSLDCGRPRRRGLSRIPVSSPWNTGRVEPTQGCARTCRRLRRCPAMFGIAACTLPTRNAEDPNGATAPCADPREPA